MNPLIKIRRQRIFTDHSSNSKTFVNEEFTVSALEHGVDNIFIEKDKFLPNLRVYDSDGEELPLMRNHLTLELLEVQLDKTPEEFKQNIRDYIKKIKEKKVYLLWIKLPPIKKMRKNQVKVLNLEYDSNKEKKPSRKIEIQYDLSSNHSVFYIIKKPEDYDFKEKPWISWTDNNGKFHEYYDWKIDDSSPIYINETSNTFSITIRTSIVKSMYVSYRFTARKNIILFPYLAVGFLTVGALAMLILHNCGHIGDCSILQLDSPKELLGKRIEFGASIVGASLVLPRLIKNDFVRSDYKWLFLIPLILGFFIFF